MGMTLEITGNDNGNYLMGVLIAVQLTSDEHPTYLPIPPHHRSHIQLLCYLICMPSVL